MGGSASINGHLASSHQRHLLAAHQDNYSKQQGQMMHPLNHHNHHHHHQKLHPTNSCSESCFSLDDCNCLQQHQHQACPKHLTFQHQQLDHSSPALQSNQTATPPIEASSLAGNCQHQEQRPQTNWTSTLGGGGARPKLWSFYVNEQHNSNRLRLNGYTAQANQQQQQQQHQAMGGMTNGAATLRAGQRTFSGQQRQPSAALAARNFECLQRGGQEAGADMKGLEPHQNDYLLVMASIGQQYQQAPLAGDGPQANPSGLEWVNPTAGPQTGQQEQQMRLLTLNPAGLLDGDRQQSLATGGPDQPQQTCAFHMQQQQQQQQQRQISFMPSEQQTGAAAPIGYQLELAPPATSAINQGPQQQQQQQHHVHHLHPGGCQ